MFEYIEMDISHYTEANALWNSTEGMGVTNDPEEKIQEYLNHNPGMSFVCIDQTNSKLAGTVLGGHDGRRGFIYHLAVPKEYRGKAIGKKLVQLSVDAMKKEEIERCIIMVKAHNDGGHGFWSNIGWESRPDLCMYSVDLTK